MQLIRKESEDNVQFIVVDASEKEQEALRALAFKPVEEGLARTLPAGTPHLDEAFVHYQTHLETMMKQATNEIAVSWEAALEAFLQRVAHLDAKWYVVGSVALALRGVPIVPGDIDLIVDSEGAFAWGDALADVMLEPVMTTTNWFSRYWARAFLHARIEWVAGIDLQDPSPYIQHYVIPAQQRLERIQ
jgi:hypothetical protein